jgi:phosphate:Na+ symporter
MGSLVLLDLMGGVALLLWGLHMVHSGILRAFGPDLRRLLAGALNNRFTAFAAGIGLTALLQSSTATALITSSFTAEGLVGLVPALAIMLGANLGTTLIVQVLSFNISALAPITGRVPRRRALSHQGYRPGLDRSRPDAAGAAHPARHAGACRERP